MSQINLKCVDFAYNDFPPEWKNVFSIHFDSLFESINDSPQAKRNRSEIEIKTDIFCGLMAETWMVYANEYLSIHPHKYMDLIDRVGKIYEIKTICGNFTPSKYYTDFDGYIKFQQDLKAKRIFKTEKGENIKMFDYMVFFTYKMADKTILRKEMERILGTHGEMTYYNYVFDNFRLSYSGYTFDREGNIVNLDNLSNINKLSAILNRS